MGVFRATKNCECWTRPFELEAWLVPEIRQSHRCFLNVEFGRSSSNGTGIRRGFKYLGALGGRLKMREWKMRYGQNCKGGNAGVEKAGADRRGGKCRSKPYGTPTRYNIETASSDFVILVLILLTVN